MAGGSAQGRGMAVQAALLLGVVAVLAGAGLALRRVLGSPRPLAAAPAVWTIAPDDPRLGRRAFAFCQGCHQPDGGGVAGTYPGLAGNPLLLGPPEPLIRLVLHGYDSRGGVWNGAMPGFAGRLADHEIAAALSWARAAWGQSAPPITAAEVAAVRRATALRDRPWTPVELLAPSPPP